MGIELIDRMNEVVVWQGIKNPEIYMKIAQALEAGEDAAQLAKQYGYRARTVKKIGLRMSRLKLHRLALSDGEQRIEIGTIAAGGGFVSAAIAAYRHFHGLFKSLELPSWVIDDGTDRITVLALRNEHLN